MSEGAGVSEIPLCFGAFGFRECTVVFEEHWLCFQRLLDFLSQLATGRRTVLLLKNVFAMELSVFTGMGGN